MHTHYSSRNSQPITIDQIAQFAPSALATEAHESRSNRYTYIPTVEIIHGMQRAGFMPYKATQSRTSDVTRREFTKHMIRFRSQEAMETALTVGDTVPEVVLVNSHDGTSSYVLNAGLFRLVCSNGMMVSDSMQQTIRIHHKGNIVDQVIDASHQITANSGRALTASRHWQRLQLTNGEQQAFAEAAHTLRFGDAEGNVDTPITAAQLLNSRRYADNGPDLWKTLNRVQENVIKGGLTAWGKDAQGHRRRTTTREVKGIDQDVKLNRALWQLAERMAELKTGRAA
jgi:hypothetical protein